MKEANHYFNLSMNPDVTDFSPTTDEKPIQQPSSLPPLSTHQPTSLNLVSNLIDLKQSLLFVKDQSQINKLQEMFKEINVILTKKENLNRIEKNREFPETPKGSKIVIQQKQKTSQEGQLNYKKIECNLQKLFMFYIDQFPCNNGHYEKRFIETAEMSMQMFMVFAKQFNILGHDAREPQTENFLEQKRRGQINNIPEQLQKQNSSDPKLKVLGGIQPFSSYKKQLIASYQKHYDHVTPKHKWWVDDKIFKKFYKPNSLVKTEGAYPFHKKVDSKTLMQFFKKNAFESKCVNYIQFKQLLSKLALIIFPGSETDPTQRILTQVLFLHKTKLMKQFFHNLHHAFDIVEKIGYRYQTPKENHIDQQENKSKKFIPKTTRNSMSTHIFSSQLTSPIARCFQLIILLNYLAEQRILSKYTSRADEVEEQEEQKQQKYKALFENIYSMKLSSQIRTLKRGKL